jgi:hypothetical protein
MDRPTVADLLRLLEARDSWTERELRAAYPQLSDATLRRLVDEALLSGLVVQDCRNRLAFIG